ncbi:hypothetical protein C1H76_7438 [Elsinoe australis]|uniref:Uncharacterized protein n=1 Tax=Elsinoe australis TaxID=40998 RepID=A0A4V6YAS4_9PEZI|nr:hypothetical protein C1H76_7438 [Elsinoe australis]
MYSKIHRLIHVDPFSLCEPHRRMKEDLLTLMAFFVHRHMGTSHTPSPPATPLHKKTDEQCPPSPRQIYTPPLTSPATCTGTPSPLDDTLQIPSGKDEGLPLVAGECGKIGHGEVFQDIALRESQTADHEFMIKGAIPVRLAHRAGRDTVGPTITADTGGMVASKKRKLNSEG